MSKLTYFCRIANCERRELTFFCSFLHCTLLMSEGVKNVPTFLPGYCPTWLGEDERMRRSFEMRGDRVNERGTRRSRSRSRIDRTNLVGSEFKWKAKKQGSVGLPTLALTDGLSPHTYIHSKTESERLGVISKPSVPTPGYHFPPLIG
jgi:hypothetical protein